MKSFSNSNVHVITRILLSCSYRDASVQYVSNKFLGDALSEGLWIAFGIAWAEGMLKENANYAQISPTCGTKPNSYERCESTEHPAFNLASWSHLIIK